MKNLICVLSLLWAPMASADSFNSVALCKPTQGEFYDHLELFYDDEDRGFLIAEINYPGAPEAIRQATIVKVEDLSNRLHVTGPDLDIFIEKGNPEAIFDIDGAQFSCEKADW